MVFNLKALMKKVFFFLLILFIGSGVYAQSQADITSMDVKFKPHIKSSNPADTLYPTTDVIILLTISDTSKMNKVHIKAGKTQGASDFFNYSIKVGDKNLPSGISCKWIGSIIEIILMNRTMNANYYYEVVSESNDGKFSLPQTYIYKKK